MKVSLGKESNSNTLNSDVNGGCWLPGIALQKDKERDEIRARCYMRPSDYVLKSTNNLGGR